MCDVFRCDSISRFYSVSQSVGQLVGYTFRNLESGVDSVLSVGQLVGQLVTPFKI